MSQSPNDPYYNAPTENSGYPQQQWPGQAPAYPPQGPTYQPTQGPLSQPGFPPQPGAYPQQGSAPTYPPTQGPLSQPGFPPQPGAYPPVQGPISQPGFSPPPGAYPQQGSAPVYPPPQGPVSYPGQPAPGYPPPGQEPYGAPPAWPNLAQPPQGPKKSNKGLIAAISIIIVLILVIGGVGAAFALHSKNNSPTPNAQRTATTNGVTPAATNGGGTNSSLNKPVQAGTDWIITVTNVATSTDSALPPKAGDTYLEITMTLKNVSATQQPISSLLQFSLADANGGKYDEALSDSNATKSPDGTVNAGQTFYAKFAYEVPQSQHTFILSFDYGLLDASDASVTWQLTV